MSRQSIEKKQGHTLISVKEASTRTTYSRTQIHTLIQRGEFPAPVRLGAKRFAFVLAEVDAWIEARMAERDATSASDPEAAQ